MPLADDYRSIAVDLAKIYVQAAGGSAHDGEAAASALAPALDRAARDAPADASVLVTFEHGASDLEMRVRCGASTAVVKQTCAFSIR